MKGEKRGYFPTLELVSVYSLLDNFNNYLQFFKTFQRNNFNAGVQIQTAALQRAQLKQISVSKSGSFEGQFKQ